MGSVISISTTMKICIVLVAVLCIGYAVGETCSTAVNCKETLCKNEDGWFLHCVHSGNNGYCICQHDTHTGAACTSGTTADCVAAHGDKCPNAGANLHYRCIDNVCHCTRH